MNLLLLFTAVCVVKVSGQFYDPLFRDLFSSRSTYIKHTLPAINSSTIVSVDLSISLLQIEDVSTKFQFLKLQTWIAMTWKDRRLQWDPSNYDNIRLIRIPSMMVWEPDITLYNNPTGVHFLRLPLVLYYDGLITSVQPSSIKSSCPIDQRRPDDPFTCSIKFGSWTYDGSMLDIKMAEGKRGFLMSEFLENPDYVVISSNSTREVKFYTCCPQPYVDIIFYITLQRRYNFQP